MKQVLSRPLMFVLILFLAATVAACGTDDEITPTTNSSVTSNGANGEETTPVEETTLADETAAGTTDSTLPDDSTPVTEESSDDPTPTTADGSAEQPSTGLLVAAGTGYIHTYDLETDSSWQRRLSYSEPWSTVALIEEKRELLIANTSGAEPVIVTSYDVDSFGQKSVYEWPDSTHISTLHSLAATSDGQYYALVMEFTDPYLEIVERDTGRIVYSGLEIATGAGMTWTADNTLVVPLDLSYEDDNERWGAIGMFTLEEFEASDDGNVDGELLVTFSRAEWDRIGVQDLALSVDDSELVYSLAGDVWVVDLEPGATPHQLTAGPRGQFGAAFAPGGDQLAIVTGDNLGLRDTYVISNHRGDPVLPEAPGEAGFSILLETGTLVDKVLGWLD